MKSYDDITLILVQDEPSVEARHQHYFKSVFRQFARVQPIAGPKADSRWLRDVPGTGPMILYPGEGNKVGALNTAVRQVQTSFILVLESDEFAFLSKLPETPEPAACYAALVDVAGREVPQRNYQLRLFPRPVQHDPLFDGFAIPDLSRTFHSRQWTLSDTLIPIHKRQPLFSMARMEAAGEEATINPFWKGVFAFEHKKYRQAEKLFHQVIRQRRLLPFDYLAALNGLAGALTEQHKLKQALEIATRSVERDRRQYAPYLTLFKIHKLMGQPGEAYRALGLYLQKACYASRANMDVSLPLSDCHFLMAETAFGEGDYEQAFRHYEWFYELNNRQVSQAVLEKLFIYAIELKNYEKSIQYFDDIFGAYIPDRLTEDMSARLLESLSLFMDNEWYDFVSGVYEELVESNPGDNQLLNGWITTLIKNKEIARAQALLRSSS